MTLFHQTFEGVADGTQITVANSATSGDAWSYIFYNNGSFPSGNANLVYSSAAALNGSMGARITLGTSNTYLGWQDTAGGSRGVIRRPIRFTANPSASATIATLRSASAGAASLSITTTGKVRASSAAVAITASEFQLSTDTTYWVELAATMGVTTSDGRVEMKIYAADGTTELWSYDSGTTANTGTATIEIARFPAATNASGWTTDDLDDVQFDGNLASGWLGPYVPANSQPTVNLSVNNSVIHPGETATITAIAADSDGTVASLGWSTTVGSLAGSGTTRTLLAHPSLVDQTATVTVIATDNEGATGSDSINITLKASMSKMYNGTSWDPIVEYLL